MSRIAILLILARAAAAQIPPPPKVRPIEFGVRFTGYLLNLLPDGSISTSQESPRVETTQTAESLTRRLGIGGVIEWRFNRKLSITAEPVYHRVGYQQTTEIEQGADLEFYSRHTEITKASQWDVPVLVRYTGLKDEGWLSHVTVTGGPAARFTTSVKSSNEYIFPDGSTEYDEIRATPSSRTIPGATVGIGFRYTDDFNFKLTPEIRYTRWFGAAFDSGAARMRRDQLELSVAITF